MPDPSAATRLRPGECVVPAVMLAIATAVLFDPQVRATLVAAFGAHPYGVPVVALVAIFQAVGMLPLLWALAHAQRIVRQAHADGDRIGWPSLLLRQRALGERHPQLRHSQLVCAFGLLYFAILCTGWIAYAHHRGI